MVATVEVTDGRTWNSSNGAALTVYCTMMVVITLVGSCGIATITASVILVTARVCRASPDLMAFTASVVEFTVCSNRRRSPAARRRFVFPRPAPRNGVESLVTNDARLVSLIGIPCATNVSNSLVLPVRYTQWIALLSSMDR